MYDQKLFYALLLFAAAAASAAAAALLWRRRRVSGVVPLFVFSLALFIWSLTYAFYWLSPSPQARLFWLDATYFGVVLAPSSFFVFTLRYTHRDRWVSRYALALLAVQPLLTLLLLWTDPTHGLFFAGKRTPESSTIFDGGPWFWLHIVYTYGMLLIAYIMLVQHYRHAEKPYRRQTGTILFAVTLPWLSNIISLADLSPLPGLDLTPIVFTLTALIITYALLYQQLFDLMPVARSKVLETMQEPVFVVDQQGRIVDVNPAAIRLLRELGPRPDDVYIGSLMHLFFPDWQEWLAVDDTAETRVDTDSQTRYYERRISPLDDAQGQQQGQVVVLSNITRRKQAQQRELEIKLEKERIQLLTTFIHSASHEFRTPLATISSSAHLITRSDDPENQASRAAVIEQQVRRITRLVDMLLLMTRLESQEQPERTPVDVAAVVKEVCKTLISEGDGPRIHCKAGPQLPPVMGDADDLFEAFRQILDNAHRFTPVGGSITVTAGQSDGLVWLEICDTGPGISDEALPYIFDTFWRQDKAHSTPGFGLGLAIARKIIHMHGGDISVQSTLGQGSTFRVTLPAA